MQTIRSFVSIPVTPQIASGARRLIKKLKSIDDRIKWVPTDNLHLTLKFLGDVDNVEIPAVCDAIRKTCEKFEPFELRFAGTGGFPDVERARVLYAGVEDPSGRLVEMVGLLESKFADLGFKPEPRDYRPHLTLGRTRGQSRRASEEIVQAMAEAANIEFGEMVVDELHLMASFLDKAGPTYQVMDTIELGEPVDEGNDLPS